jgi:polysaccharide export outer membrane protein
MLPLVATWVIGLVCTGCYTAPNTGPAQEMTVPTELLKVSLPDYTVAPPDVLLIDAVTLIPRPPYKIAPLDVLVIRVTVYRKGAEDKEGGPATLSPGAPIDGLYRVEADGTVNLGFDYGSVRLVGQTIPQAKKSITDYLKVRFKVQFEVSMALAESRALQQIKGEHLIRQDGRVSLGTYGSVWVAGMTVEQAKSAIEAHLAQYLLNPEISVDVAGYNSKVYYVIFDQDGAGEQVLRLPITGNETVLDAIGQVNGLPAGSNKRRIWVARPSPADSTCSQLLPVDWHAITKAGATKTNYQLLPGDRVYVAVDPWIAADSYLAKVISPFNRILGVTLLGNSVVHGIAIPLGTSGIGGVGGTGAIR